MNMRRIILFATVILVFSQCTRDKLDVDLIDCSTTVTYNDQIEPLIETYCSYTGCHNGIDRFEDFNFYTGLEQYLTPAMFEARVVDLRDMPPSNANGPITIEDEDFQLIRCWIIQGYKEN